MQLLDSPSCTAVREAIDLLWRSRSQNGGRLLETQVIQRSGQVANSDNPVEGSSFCESSGDVHIHDM